MTDEQKADKLCREITASTSFTYEDARQAARLVYAETQSIKAVEQCLSRWSQLGGPYSLAEMAALAIERGGLKEKAAAWEAST